MNHPSCRYGKLPDRNSRHRGEAGQTRLDTVVAENVTWKKITGTDVIALRSFNLHGTGHVEAGKIRVPVTATNSEEFVWQDKRTCKAAASAAAV